jgi:hypothetical protein
MDDQAEYKYDVFISYSHADRNWVWNELLPRLEQAELKIIIDERDFEIGVPSIINMERAADNSRHTLVVLTPAWLKSEWTEFESLLVGTADPAGRRRKLIPLMLKPCELPPRIAMLTYADFTEPLQRDAQMTRLLKSLGFRGSSPVPRLGYAPEIETRSGQANDGKPVQSTKLSEKITEILSARMWQGIAAIAGVLAIVAVFVVPEVRQFVGLERPTLIADVTSAATPTRTPTETPSFTPTSTATTILAATDVSNPTNTPSLTSPSTPTHPSVPDPEAAPDGPYLMTLFADENSLTVYMPANVTSSLSDLNLKYSMNGQEERYFFADSEGFVPYIDGSVPPPFCLHLERAGSSVPFPLECQAANRPIVRLPSGSIFWWDEFGQNTKTLFVNLGEEPLEVCATGFSRCSVEIP